MGNGYRGDSIGEEKVLRMDGGYGCTQCEYVQCHRNVQLNG